MDLKERMEQILIAFDNLDLDDMYMRRMAVKPLYDFYQILLLEVGVTHCHLLRDTLANYPLSARWREVRHYLNLIGKEPSVWDQTISSLQRIRRSNEHSDYHDPKKQTLRFVRKNAPKFMEWVLSAGAEYLRQSKGFSFIDQYVRLSHAYSRRTAYIKHQYGEKIPLSVREEFPDLYSGLVPMREALQSRLPELRCVHDLTGEDLDRLVTLVRNVERIEAREHPYVRFSVCPKCGGRITETQQVFSQSSEDPKCGSIYYRVGCETCDFELVSETIDV